MRYSMSAVRAVTASVCGVLACGGLMLGCASTAPSQQLIAARSAYQQASMSRAADDAPAELLTAKQSLDRAEKEHKDEPGSDKERHLAYIAERHAKLASAQADIVAAERARAQAEHDYVAYQEQMRLKAAQDLQLAQQELRDIRNQMAQQQSSGEIQRLQQRQAEIEARRAELEGQLTGRTAELETERAARAEAEKRAQSALESLKQVGDVKSDEKGETIITLSGSVLFPPADTKLLPVARNSLDKVADVLKEQGDKVIIVEGHADAQGPAKRNEALSLMRAESVRDYLVDKGLDASRVKAVGRGEQEPVASNETPTGRAHNRRVEIIIRDAEAAGGEGG